MRNNNPSHLSITLFLGVNAANKIKTGAAIITNTSTRVIPPRVNGVTIEQVPKIKRILKILENQTKLIYYIKKICFGITIKNFALQK